MSDRRRASRFMLTDSNGKLRLMQHVYVETTDATHVTIVTDVPIAAGHNLLIELPQEDYGRPVLHVRSSECTPVPFGDVLRYRVLLQVLHRRTSSIVACVGVRR